MGKHIVLGALIISVFYLSVPTNTFAGVHILKIYADKSDGNRQLYEPERIRNWNDARNYSGSLQHNADMAIKGESDGVRSDNHPGYYLIYRASIPFDTSTIPREAVITSASINLHAIEGHNRNVVELNFVSHDRSSLLDFADEDWQINNFGNSVLAQSAILLENQPESFELSTDGIEYLNREGFTIFGVLTHWDKNNILPPSQPTNATWHSADATDEAMKPFLEITYELPEEEKTIEELIAELEGFVANDVPAGEVQHSYRAHTQIMQALYAEGSHTALKNQLLALQKKIFKDLQKDKLAAAEGEALLELLEAILINLTELADTDLVPLITQVASPNPLASAEWADDVYASGSANDSCGITIAECGCALASLSMLSHYYGVTKDIIGNEVNPGNMNNWLVANAGYTAYGSVYWGKVFEYLGQEVGGKIMTPFKMVAHNERSKTVIDAFLALAQPVVAFSERLGHFFLITDKSDTDYGVRDPFWYNTTTLTDTKDVANHVQDYRGEVDRANLIKFSKQPQSLSMLEIHLGSPAELLLTDAKGRRAGYDPATGEVVNEIPGSSYDQGTAIFTGQEAGEQHQEKVLMVLAPEFDSYQLEVIGTGEGEYTLSTYAAGGGTSTVSELLAATSEGQRDVFTVEIPGDDDSGHGNDVDRCDEGNPGHGEECGE